MASSSVSRRRLIVTALAVVVAAIVAVAAVTWPRTPSAAAGRSGDPVLLDAIGATAGLHRVSVAYVDLRAATPARFAGVGADEHTPYEAGSVTKALTGLVIADEVRRGELALDQPVDRYLPLAGTAAGSRTMTQLVTHSSGLPALGAGTRWRAALDVPLGRNPYSGRGVDDVLGELRDADPAASGTYAYSNLGASAAGLAAASAAGTDYPTLMQQRLFTPLGLTETHTQTATGLVPRGYAASGRRQQPWVMTGYAPAGSVVSTSADLAKVATALLRGTAPGMAALDPLAVAGDGEGRRIGIFWQQSERAGRTITWHNGATGGYHAFVGLDRDRQRAVVVLADVQTDAVDQLGMDLVTRP